VTNPIKFFHPTDAKVLNTFEYTLYMNTFALSDQLRRVQQLSIAQNSQITELKDVVMSQTSELQVLKTLPLQCNGRR